jgi:hypothetical protein
LALKTKLLAFKNSPYKTPTRQALTSSSIAPQPPAKRLKRGNAEPDLNKSACSSCTGLEKEMAIITAANAQLLIHSLETNSLRMQKLELAVKALTDVIFNIKQLPQGQTSEEDEKIPTDKDSEEEKKQTDQKQI